MHLLESWWGLLPLPKTGKEKGARHKLEAPKSPCWIRTLSLFWILIRLLLRTKFDWSLVPSKEESKRLYSHQSDFDLISQRVVICWEEEELDHA